MVICNHVPYFSHVNSVVAFNDSFLSKKGEEMITSMKCMYTSGFNNNQSDGFITIILLSKNPENPFSKWF